MSSHVYSGFAVLFVFSDGQTQVLAWCGDNMCISVCLKAQWSASRALVLQRGLAGWFVSCWINKSQEPGSDLGGGRCVCSYLHCVGLADWSGKSLLEQSDMKLGSRLNIYMCGQPEGHSSGSLPAIYLHAALCLQGSCFLSLGLRWLCRDYSRL